MGAKQSKSPDDILKAKKSKLLELEMAQTAEAEKAKVKLLLLGAGECGKSTIFKQMKLIYGTKYTDEERLSRKSVIFNNILCSMKILVSQIYEYKMQDMIKDSSSFKTIVNLQDYNNMTPELGNVIEALWKDPIIQEVWSRRSEYQIIESVKYYFDKMNEIKQLSYVPTESDILFLRVKTSGIVTESYLIDKKTFEMYDVGGQRNERRKWIHCFEGVTAVIFVVGLSEFDQCLVEDGVTNRMEEAIELFDKTFNNTYFNTSSMILFLNKKDLFAEKLLKKKIADIPAFKDYTGNNDYQSGIEYFLKKFTSKNKDPSRKIYHHVTCATDTSNVKIVLNSCKDIILKENLKQAGIAFD